MSSINKVMLVGNVGRDAEVKSFPSGDLYMEFSVATSESWKGKDGEWKENTQWHKIKVLNGAKIKYIQDRIYKGVKVYIEGQVEYRSWEKDGQKQYMTEIVVPKFGGEVKIMERPKASADTFDPNDAFAGATSIPSQDELNDDVPF